MPLMNDGPDQRGEDQQKAQRYAKNQPWAIAVKLGGAIHSSKASAKSVTANSSRSLLSISDLTA